MVTIEQIQRGCVNYVDKYLIPQMTPLDKVIKGGIIGLYVAGLPNVIGELIQVAKLDKIGVVTAEGYDIDKIAEGFIRQLEANGAIKQDIKLIGELTIDAEAVRQLVQEIKGA